MNCPHCNEPLPEQPLVAKSIAWYNLFQEMEVNPARVRAEDLASAFTAMVNEIETARGDTDGQAA
jgi:hypothetical protein